MEHHTRVALLDTLLEEAAQKRTALTHALNARERVAQGEASTHGAPLTIEEEGLKYEHDLWQKVEITGAEMRHVLEEIEQVELQRGLS
jgi:ribosomal protein L5